MMLRPFHNRMALFTDNAEAMAIHALNYPVMTAGDARLEEDNVQNEYFARAFVWIDGQEIPGYTKSTNIPYAAKHIFVGSVATLLGAPMAAYMLLTHCPPHPNRSEENHAKTLRLFSAEPFHDYEKGENFIGEIAEHSENLTGDVMSLAAVGQFRAFINDADGFAHNILRDTRTQHYSLIDPGLAAPHLKNLEDGNRDLIANARTNIASDMQAQRRYDKDAAIMARRICTLDDMYLKTLQEKMAKIGVTIPSHFVQDLQVRRPLFKTPILPERFHEFD